MKKLLAVASAALYLASSVAFAKDKPNILIILRCWLAKCKCLWTWYHGLQNAKHR